MDPTVFITPPAPDNFVAILNTNGTDVRLTWNVAQGGVTNYTITRAVYDSDIGDYVFSPVAVVGANTNAFVQLGAIATADDLGDYYEIAANYPGGNTSDGSFSQIYPDYYVPPAPPAPPYDIVVTASLIRNSTGRWQLMFPALPTTAQNINLIWTDTNGVASTQSIPGSALTNGIYQIADTNALAHLGAAISVQGVGASGELGKIAPAGTLANDAPCFVDGSEHLKQNLLFQLRAATVSQPNVLPYEYNAFVTPEYPRASVPVDANYVESGIFHWSTLSDGSGCTDYMKMDDLWPFTVNYEFHQYLFDPNYTGSSSFHWTNNLATVPAPAVLGLSDPFWILLSLSFYFEPCSGVAINPADGLPVNPITIDPAAEVGGFVSGSDFNLQSGTHNLYGLAFETALIISSGADPVTNTLALDSSTSVTNVNTFYTQTVLPSLQFVNYYFAPVNTPGAAPSGSLGQVQAYPLPALTNFASTNLTKTIIASVGQPIVIGGWEKFSILNGGSGKRAYLGQYFVTNAYLLDASGNLTATNAGVLSPYGEFFPTQAGKAQLVTVPDSGRQGTCTVSVISLNLDANHDGAMDLSYFGQDQTSPGKPYVFWCNNNFDRWDDDFPFGTREMDDVLAGGQDISNEDPNNSDNNYHSFYGQRAIPTTRDLEDFSRLGVTGLTPDLYSNLPAGSTVTFNWGDVASPNPANPTIDIFSADAGLDYLTNETEAADVVTHSALKYIGRVSPGQSVPLDPFNISILGHSHFIWCGVTNGSGKLSLTFKDAQGNTFGEASVYIQIVDVKQMYERWTVGDNPGVTPNPVAILAQNGLSNGQRAFQYGPPATNTTYILHVHGYNMPITAKDSFGSTAFKRLFWQGYQGRFGTFYWPTAQNAVQFGGSEAQAWLSGQGLLNKLIALKIQYPGHVYLLAHSLGNVVAGEALRLAGTNQLVNTYVAMQGAITAHAYDPTTTPYTLTEDWGAPDCYAHYWTSGAPCYFNSSVGAGLYVNFYNTNDWALNFWLTFQNSKPVLDLNYSFSPPDSYFKNSGSTELFFPADTYELFDEIIQSRSYALGAQANVAGAFKTLTDNQVALPSVWPPDLGNYSAHVWHSAEFRSDNAQRWQFWNAVLVRMGLK
ncbi:MAG TPA: hypothetical protein VG347_10620 [Verrucomicrobiae bacterium]|nr:hypothetical protein [Verrucomicrobiae bacterium]